MKATEICGLAVKVKIMNFKLNWLDFVDVTTFSLSDFQTMLK